MKLLLFVCLLAFNSSASSDRPAAFEPFDGNWRGTFQVFSAEGELLTELGVEQSYRWEGNVQVADFREVDTDGNVTTAKAKNFRNEAGELICRVEKSTGDVTEHVGRVTDGNLFWYGPNECFREEVVTINGVPSYTIDGFGTYGDTTLLFKGRYQRVE
ncbi:MAG: hypothetical protein AAGD32_06560 [Planctomycetota bacterium]